MRIMCNLKNPECRVIVETLVAKGYQFYEKTRIDDALRLYDEEYAELDDYNEIQYYNLIIDTTDRAMCMTRFWSSTEIRMPADYLYYSLKNNQIIAKNYENFQKI